MTAAGVLAGRIAATLVHHEPGWRLPRLTTMARRYQVNVGEIEAAIDDLVSRHLVRRLPDGQLYRASPAEYRLTLAGVAGLAGHVDPMGGELACTSHQATRRRVPEDIGRALRIAPGAPVVAIKCVWAVGGEPGALSASYVPEQFAAKLGDSLGEGAPGESSPPPAATSPARPPAGTLAAAASLTEPTPGLPGRPSAPCDPAAESAAFPFAFPLPLRSAAVGAAYPYALQIEMGPPPPSAGRRLRISVGEPVITVTASYVDPRAGLPVALTMAMLRPELFRIVVEATPAGISADGKGGLTTAWTQDGLGWES
jgi:hypothetical protein